MQTPSTDATNTRTRTSTYTNIQTQTLTAPVTRRVLPGRRKEGRKKARQNASRVLLPTSELRFAPCVSPLMSRRMLRAQSHKVGSLPLSLCLPLRLPKRNRHNLYREQRSRVAARRGAAALGPAREVDLRYVSRVHAYAHVRTNANLAPRAALLSANSACTGCSRCDDVILKNSPVRLERVDAVERERERAAEIHILSCESEASLM